MKPTLEERADALERWADNVRAEDLVEADISALGRLAELALDRRELESQIGATVGDARRAGRSWAQIGAALGVTKQAAQQRYGDPDLSRTAAGRPLHD